MYRQADWLAGTYGWTLKHIFEYVTVDDINELIKYQRPRLEREQADRYTMLAGIIKVTSYHEKGSDKAYNRLISELEYKDHDTGYIAKKLDIASLELLKATRAANGAR